MDDYAELGSFTEDYLNMYFKMVFSETPEVVYVSSTTEVAGSEFRLGQPVRVDYNTTLTFTSLSTLIPEMKDLNVLLASAFEGSNAEMYTTALAAGLPSTNIFSTTTSITYEQTPVVTTNSASSRAGIAAGSAAAAFVMILAGVTLYRRKGADDEGTTKNLMAHMTVDGDTHVGDDPTQGSHSLAHPTKYRFDGGASLAPSTVEWGEYPEDVVPNTARFHTISTEYNSEEEEGDDDDSVETEEAKEEVEEAPKLRPKRLDDVSL